MIKSLMHEFMYNFSKVFMIWTLLNKNKKYYNL
jgi:hypothetical protein